LICTDPLKAGVLLVNRYTLEIYGLELVFTMVVALFSVLLLIVISAEGISVRLSATTVVPLSIFNPLVPMLKI
jgi:hypothetical protein